MDADQWPPWWTCAKPVEKCNQEDTEERNCFAWGDPHFTTFDGTLHDYYGVGEMVYYHGDTCMDESGSEAGTVLRLGQCI